jgi:hypothetical protein
MTPFILSIITVALFFAYRFALIRFSLKSGNNSYTLKTDQWFHLVLIKAIRQNGHRPPLRLDGYKESILSYPWFTHWFLSLMPPSSLQSASFFLGTYTDALLLLFFQFLTIHIASALGPQLLQNLLWANLVLFISSPLLTRTKTGKFTIRARPFGVLLFSLTFLTLFLFYRHANPLFYLLALILASSIFVTSKFANQALLGYSLLLGVALKNLWIILFPFLAFLVSVVITRGWSWRIVKMQAKHLRLYWTDIYDSYHSVRDKGSFTHLKNILTSPHKLSSLDKVYQTNPYVILIVSMPFVLLYPLILSHSSAILPSTTLFFLNYWFLSGLILLLVTSIGKLKIFGQAERYLDFCFLPYALLTSIYIVDHLSPLVLLLILMGGGFSMINFWVRKRKRNTSQSQSEHEVKAAFQWLDGCPERLVVLPIPLNFANYGVYHTKHTYLSAAFIGLLASEKGERMQKRFRELIDNYPYPTTNLEQLVKSEAVDAIVVLHSDRTKRYDTSSFDKVFENQRVSIYEVPQTKKLKRLVQYSAPLIMERDNHESK